jgi:hypothetical protein
MHNNTMWMVARPMDGDGHDSRAGAASSLEEDR